MRNYYVASTWEFSGIQSVNLLFYRGADVLAQRDGISFKEAQKQLGYKNYTILHPETAEWSQARLNRHWRQEAMKLLRQYPLLVLKTQIKGLMKILLGPGRNTLSHYIDNTPLAGFERLLTSVSFLVLFLLYLCIVIALLCLGNSACRQESEVTPSLSPHFFWGTIAVYLLVVSAGPEAYSRFRIPLMPLLSVYAGFGGTRILKAVFQKKT